MRRVFTILLLTSITGIAYAQTTDGDNKSINIDQNGDNAITSNNGNLLVSIAGMNFEIGEQNAPSTTKSTSSSKCERVRFSYAGIGGSSLNHLALFELGTNVLSNADYSMYSSEEAQMLPFGNHKSIYFAINLISMNVPFNKRRTLGFEMGFGFSLENYTFAGAYSMKYQDGMMHPITLEGDIKKSKMSISYLHMPLLLNWNFKKRFFIAAGINLDILVSSALKFKKPKTTIEGEITLNPIQVGATARIGWRKLYGFVNYSFMEIFKQNTGPGGNRLSAGVGLFF